MCVVALAKWLVTIRTVGIQPDRAVVVQPDRIKTYSYLFLFSNMDMNWNLDEYINQICCIITKILIKPYPYLLSARILAIG